MYSLVWHFPSIFYRFDIILKILKTCEEASSIDFGSELRWSSGPWTLCCLFSANQIHMQGSVGIPGLHHICVWQTKPSSRGFPTSSSTKLLEYPGDTTHNFFCALHYLFVENFNLECRKSIRVHNDLMCCFLLLHLVLYIISPLTRSKKFYCMFHLMEVSDWYRRVWTAVIGPCEGGRGHDLTGCSDPGEHSFHLSFYYLIGWKRARRSSEVWQTERAFITTARHAASDWMFARVRGHQTYRLFTTVSFLTQHSSTGCGCVSIVHEKEGWDKSIILHALFVIIIRCDTFLL